ncbi:endonuclease YncB(thermonuclease family) [Rhizobium leguminosarum]|nr:thermonuclease family protein [Rhizobium leguminosarum]MBP2449886.1 endonuclease YncB(thermonuclease family) [Rhizobium leguminosarum]
MKRTLSGVTSVAIILNAISLVSSAEAAQLTVTTRFAKCSSSIRKNCVVDGDTLWINGQKVRVADIDAPEIGTPKCASELSLGNRATDRLIELVNAGPFQLQAWPGRDEDRYGRKLRVLARNGHSLGDILVSEGLARTWSGWARVPVGLEVHFDLDEERDLDRDLQAEFPFAEEVTNDLAESAKTAAGGSEELGELLHDGSPVIAFHRGDEIAEREGVLHRDGRSAAEDPRATEFCLARKP